MGKAVTWIIIAAALAVGVYIGIKESGEQSELKKANHLKDEANAAWAAGEKFVETAEPKFSTLTNSETMAGFPGNKPEHEATARETADMYQKAIEQFRLGSKKLDEASKQRIDSDVANYFGAWSQVHGKMADRREVDREFLLLWLDKDVDTQEELTTRTKEIEKRLEQIIAATDELVEKANKIKADHPDKLQ